MVKFNRSEVQRIIQMGNVTLYVSGKVIGAAFSGYAQIRVIESANNDGVNGNNKGGKEGK